MATARRVVLIHWNQAEAAERLRQIQVPGFRLEHLLPKRAADWAPVRSDPPVAVLIDLSRLPSHGCEAALGLRGTRATRTLPIVFVAGAEDKVAAVRAKVPDAIYCTWSTLAPALAQAASAPPAPMPRRAAAASGYSGTPLPQKLGIKDHARVLVVDAPDELTTWLEPLPVGVELVRDRARGEFPVVWLFTTSRKAFVQKLPLLVPALAERGHLWVSWPKKTSGVASDMTEGVIRDHALTIGLVDTKVCAVNAVWSGLRLNRRAKT